MAHVADGWGLHRGHMLKEAAAYLRDEQRWARPSRQSW